MSTTLVGVFVFVFCFATVRAQEPVPQTPAPSGQTPAAEAEALAARLGGPQNSQAPQAYERVITKDAITKGGIFTVHQVKERYYFEIPKAELNREFLLVSQIARTTLGVGYGGQFLGDRVVRWERVGNKINLRSVDYNVVADARKPIATAVKAANNDTIIMSFPLAALGKEANAGGDKQERPEASATTDKDVAKAASANRSARPSTPAPYQETGREPTVVIDVTRLFTTDVFELGAKQRLNATVLDPTRSYVERITPYPQNVETEATLTYTRISMPFGVTTQQPLPAALVPGGMRPGSATVVLHHSMVKLPDTPMMPRLMDERVGYFSVRQMDYGRDEHRAPHRTYITRWRLEKKDPSAEISEPVKPIVYYIDAATPSKWVPYLKKGVESWQPAFEAAGFKNAVIAKLAPTHEEDPNFSPEDVRYSVIRWLPSTIENAVGPHIADPRTGEILNADIQFYHNVMNLARDWYFVQVGPLDPRAQKLPLPDDLMGRLVEFVVAHEVGHTLGFQHNMKSSSMYPADKLRDKDWLAKMGHTASIMDYSRFNYVVQPEDHIPVENLVPGVGPYDIYATRWGYKPVANATDPDAERTVLDGWAREQDKTPWLRFSTPGSGGSDPGELTEAVGDGDAIQSTGYGVKNLQRVAKMLLTATSTKEGDPFEDLAELYGRMLGQWTLEMNHVAAIAGGLHSQQKNIGQMGVIYTPEPKARQAAAVRFLNENAFATPAWAIDKEILRRIEPIGSISRIGNAQRAILNNLLSSPRFARLVEAESLDGSSMYTAAAFLADVRHGVWHELDTSDAKVDAYRRQLQRSYLDLVNSKINGAVVTIPNNLPAGFPVAFLASSGDEKSFYRAELRGLAVSLRASLQRNLDRETRAHLEAARDRIAEILDPKFLPPGAANVAAARILAFDWMRWSGQDFGYLGQDGSNGADVDQLFTPFNDNCWPDYQVRP